jgi:hypothetical protein
VLFFSLKTAMGYNFPLPNRAAALQVMVTPQSQRDMQFDREISESQVLVVPGFLRAYYDRQYSQQTTLFCLEGEVTRVMRDNANRPAGKAVKVTI